jgi:hypothetical protein
MFGTPEYRAWSGIITRCCNANHNSFREYGGRGITVCREWRESFAAFHAFVGNRPSAKHSIDRIDNSGNYEPGNVRWATDADQANNRRTSRLISYNGETRTLAEWSKVTGVAYHTLLSRIDRDKWPLKRAFEEPAVHVSVRNRVVYEFQGQSLSLREWADQMQVSHRTLRARVQSYGWSIERALTTPFQWLVASAIVFLSR